MRFRLAADLPVEAHLGDGTYVLELVHGGATDEWWLRARAVEEPTVFLLARFEDESAAMSGCYFGFEPVAGPFPRALLHHLVAQGAAAVFRPQISEPEPLPVSEPESAYALVAS